MKTLLALAFAIVSIGPTVSAQTSSGFTGKWEGTFSLQRPDGTAADPRPIVFNLTQKGKELSGTAGPPNQEEKVIGTVAGSKATFEVQLPQGPPFKFSLTLAKGRLQGDMTREVNGTLRTAKVDAGKVVEKKK